MRVHDIEPDFCFEFSACPNSDDQWSNIYNVHIVKYNNILMLSSI